MKPTVGAYLRAMGRDPLGALFYVLAMVCFLAGFFFDNAPVYLLSVCLFIGSGYRAWRREREKIERLREWGPLTFIDGTKEQETERHERPF